MKILVLAGGISTERDVSLVTGKNVYDALKKMGHNTVLIDVYLGDESLEDCDLDKVWEDSANFTGKNKIDVINPDISTVKSMRNKKYKGFFGPGVLTLAEACDVVFLALHGENGENGKIQAFFELMDIKFTGTDSLSAGLAMNKELAKEIMTYYNIPNPKSIYIRKGENRENTIGYPCVVKACNGGSSLGVSLAENEKEYQKGIEEAFQYDNEVVVEEYIKGREFSVCVMEGTALPIIEIKPKIGFYDYKNKYQSDSCIEICPAELPEENTRKMQKYACDVFNALRLKNYARMDFLMKENGDMYCLEANTLPGMTATSLVPQEAAAIGIGFEELVWKIIQAALK